MIGDISGVTCHCYFKGRDGLGTCNTACQWHVEGEWCPQWIPPERWDTDNDFKPDTDGKKSTLEQYQDWSGAKISIESDIKWLNKK